MASTNKTTNLELSQFLGSDSPKWLTDYNADMEKIDAGYQTVKAQADATDIVVSGHTSSISTLQDTTTSQGSAITQLRTDVNGNSGSINTINELLGNGEPTTSNKTIIGAINELDEGLESFYKPTHFDKTAVSVTADGVKTYAELLDDATTEYATYVSTLTNKTARVEYINISDLARIPTQTYQSAALDGSFGGFGTNGTRDLNYAVNHLSNGWRISSCEIASDGTVTHTNLTNAVPASGVTIRVIVTEYANPS